MTLFNPLPRTALKAMAMAGLLAVPGVGAMAQTEALTLSSMTVTRHNIVRNIDGDLASACCAQHVYESGADTDFIYIDVDFAVAWSDEIDRIQVSSGDIVLQLDNEPDARRPWGRVDYFPNVQHG